MAGVKTVNGITEETYKRLLLDSGAVYKNYGEVGEVLLGATRGGNTAVIESETREMVVDGAPGPVKGSQRRIRTTAKLTVNIVEMTTAILKLNLVGAESTANASHDTVTRDTQIAAGDYLSNVTLVLQKAGTNELFGFKLKNALSLSNFELGASDDDESVTTLEFTAHFDPDDLATEPWEIFNPLESPSAYYTFRYSAAVHGTISGDPVQTVAAGQSGTLVTAVADTGYDFVQWSDGVLTAGRTDTNAAADKTVIAVFISE